ncbi:unnamed protein product [Rotaria sp. Silwood1]|nr:unnamed protein product [Rotaria sp. Silwood1]
MLNGALRQQNVDLLILFQFFIRDIYEQLKELQKKQSPWPSTRVYRGQLMSKEEIGILMSCEGRLISMNSFLSTTRDQNYALTIVESGANNPDELIPVLFEIDLDPCLSETKPYADITRKSAIPDEDEVLLMLGSVFRLNHIHLESDGRSFTIQLSLTNKDQNEVRELFDCMKIEAENDNVLYSLAYILFNSGKLDAAERCYRRYLNDQPEENVNAAKTYQSLGAIFQLRGEYDSALEILNKAVKIFDRKIPYANPFVAITHTSIGNLHLRRKDPTSALCAFEKALHMFKQVHGEEHQRVAMCLNNMGLTFQAQKKFDEACFYYQQALTISEKTLPANHPNLAASHMNIGILHANLGQFELALEHLECSLQMKHLSLPPDHPDLGDTYGNMAAVYQRQGNLSKALALYEKALSIFAMTLPSTHAKISATKNYIGKLKQMLF